MSYINRLRSRPKYDIKKQHNHWWWLGYNMFLYFKNILKKIKCFFIFLN